MKMLYYISQLKLTAAIIAGQTETEVPLLNETLRPHLEHIEDQEGDIVHGDLEAAKELAKNILYDLGDKGIDVLAIGIEDEVYDGLAATGDIRESARKDAFGRPMLKLSQHACHVINRSCTVMPLRHMLPPNHVISNMETVH
ncbi:MAG: hypothetical protein JST01_03430 [Cyanobacteria bacterium SZAS TMP-1]|nr:hypothetical protein [Cyanobacteria bacterium SZAS TMP-1]